MLQLFCLDTTQYSLILLCRSVCRRCTPLSPLHHRLCNSFEPIPISTTAQAAERKQRITRIFSSSVSSMELEILPTPPVRPTIATRYYPLWQRVKPHFPVIILKWNEFWCNQSFARRRQQQHVCDATHNTSQMSNGSRVSNSASTLSLPCSHPSPTPPQSPVAAFVMPARDTSIRPSGMWSLMEENSSIFQNTAR